MFRETWDLWVFLVLTIGIILTGSFWGGRVYERRIWHTLVPEQMQAVCEECRSGGESEGLKTCDDVINQKENERSY